MHKTFFDMLKCIVSVLKPCLLDIFLYKEQLYFTDLLLVILKCISDICDNSEP